VGRWEFVESEESGDGWED